MVLGTFIHHLINSQPLSVSNLCYYFSHAFDEIIKNQCSIST